MCVCITHALKYQNVVPQPMPVQQYQQQQLPQQEAVTLQPGYQNVVPQPFPQQEAVTLQPGYQNVNPGLISPLSPPLRRSTRPTRGQTDRYKDFVQHLGLQYMDQYVPHHQLNYVNGPVGPVQQPVHVGHYQQPLMFHPGVIHPRHCSDYHKQAAIEWENNQRSVTW